MSIADITGTVNVSASFDGSATGISPITNNFHWTWDSVPGASSLQNQSYQMPDNSVNTYFDMTSNELLIHFDGNANDTSGNGRNGTASGGTYTTGRVGANSIALAAADYVSFGTNLRYTNQDFSFAFWMKPGAGQASYAAVFSCYDTAQAGYYFQQNAGNTNVYSLIGNNGSSWQAVGATMALTANVWQHIALVRSGTTVTAYVNGELEYNDTNAVASTIGYSTGNPDFVIGGVTSAGTWNGEVDEFASWTRALTALEVSNLFFMQSGSMATDTVGNLGMGEVFTFVPDTTGLFETTLVVTGSSPTPSFVGGATASIGIQNVSTINMFSSVVHNSSPATANAINLYTSVVHNATPPTATGINLFSSVVHNPTQISGTLADITGTVGVSASFDGTVLEFSTSSVNLQWTWQSVPAGSSLTNQSYPLPDNNANTYFDMTDNLGLWHFEGNADDTSGNGNNGTVNGATLVAGRIGNEAYSFNGINNSIDITSAFAFTTQDFSLAFWVQEGASQSGFTNIFGNQSSQKGFCLEASTSGGHSYRIVTGDGSWTFGTPVSLTPGVWTHLAITRSGTTINIYKDGTLAASDSYFPASISPATIPMWLGGNQSSGRYWQGILDEFAIWERTLSDLEVNNLYFLQSGSLATDLVGNVGLGETFTFVPDVTGTFTTNLTVTDGASSLSGNVNAFISSAPTPPTPTPIITGSNPTVKLVEASPIGYVLNTYSNNLLSVQRSRVPEQVPFKLGTKGRQSLRLRTNTEFTGSS